MSAPPYSHAITVERLVRNFEQIRAVDQLSFSVEAGSITALLGGNGAGKTTTLAMLLGLLVPDAGSITIL